MNTTEVIAQFRLQVDDSTELSSVEELQLLNDVYLQTASERPWQILKTQSAGTIVSGEIALPSDFAFLYNNYDYNSSMVESRKPVVFVGSTYKPFIIVNFEERRQYRDRSNYAYLDIANNKLVFTQTPTETTYEFDYVRVPAMLTAGATLIFPPRFCKKFAYDMAIQDSIIQMSDRAATMVGFNTQESNRYMGNLQMWDSKLQII